MLKTTIQKIDSNHYELIGHLDSNSIPELLTQMDAFRVKQNDSIIIDLKDVTHSSSAGIALLLEWLRNAKDTQFDLQFTNMPIKMKAIAEICGLSEILPLK